MFAFKSWPCYWLNVWVLTFFFSPSFFQFFLLSSRQLDASNITKLSVWWMRKGFFFLGRKITTHPQKISKIFFFFSPAERQDLILKVHAEEKRKYLMELKPRMTLLIKIGTFQKFNIKVIINEILVLKVVFCWLFEHIFFSWDLLHKVRAFFFQSLAVNGTRSFAQENTPLQFLGKRKY